MPISNAFFSVDSFFLIGGLLTCYVFMKEVDKLNGKISFSLILKYYIHRLWRITPPYMLVLLFATCLTQYLGNGPEYPTKEGFNPDCRETWWRNLLYINNFFTGEVRCFGASWYLGVDMQLHIVSPLLLIPFASGSFIGKLIGYLTSILLIFINIALIIVLLVTDEGSELGVFS